MVIINGKTYTEIMNSAYQDYLHEKIMEALTPLLPKNEIILVSTPMNKKGFFYAEGPKITEKYEKTHNGFIFDFHYA